MRLHRSLTVLFGSIACLSLSAAAQVRPLAAPFQLTSVYDFDGRADYISYGPRVVPLAGGGFAAAWQSIEEHIHGGPGDHFAGARVVQSSGVLPAESFLASGMPPWQVWPQNSTVAADGTGGFLAAWDDTTQIVVQPFAADGSRHASWHINGDPGRQAVAPEVVGNGGGDVAIAWLEQGQAAPKFRLLVQVFHPDGTPVTEKVILPVRKPRRTGVDHRLGMDGEGRLVLVWRDGWSLRGQRFDSSGAPAGGPFTITPRTTTKAVPVRLAVAADGGFAVAWGDLSISLQTYSAGGAPAGKPRTLNGKLVDLATDSRGNLALAALEPAGEQSRFRISLFDRSLLSQGKLLIPDAGPALTGALALADSGELLIVWGGQWITWSNGAEQAPLLGQLWRIHRNAA